MPFNPLSELIALFAIGGSFGAWIGVIWPEIDNIAGFEVVLFYVQHQMASFICPMLMYFNNRYDLMRYVSSWRIPLFNFAMFSVYMRLFLTPLSQLTWANLNHTLCSTGDDPFDKAFGLGKWYYFWAELYLLIPSFLIQYGNAYVALFLFGRLDNKKPQEK